LVKVLQATGTFNFSVNICEPEPNVLYRGNRVWGLKFVSDPGSVSSVPMVTAPETFALEQNYPNPFNPATQVTYRIPDGGARMVRLAVYDVTGREVALLASGERQAGEYVSTWKADGIASGVYFCRLLADGRMATRKMLLVR
jgi:hypothetical protein